MFKFKLLLWLLTRLLQQAINTQPACAKYVEGKDLVFQIRTRDGTGRHFTIADRKVRSSPGLNPAARFTLSFRDAARGFSILSAKNGKEAFLNALHDQELDISGDFVEVMWFQGLTEYLQPRNN
jgi:hypothetical protein